MIFVEDANPFISVLSILLSALGFIMEDTDGELGTVVDTAVLASGALSRRSECLDLLLNLREILVSNVLLLSSFFLLSVDIDLEEKLEESLVIDVMILLLFGGCGALPLCLAKDSVLDRLLPVELSLRTLNVGVPVVLTHAGAGETVADLFESEYWFETKPSFGKQTGTRLVLMSTAFCNIGLEICKLRKFPFSCFGGPSKLCSDEVGERLLVSSFFSTLSI